MSSAKRAAMKALRLGTGARPHIFPPHLGVKTPEEWRALKRQEWREVMHALQRYQYGAAYTPAGTTLYKAASLLQQIEEAVNADGWIAW